MASAVGHNVLAVRNWDMRSKLSLQVFCFTLSVIACLALAGCGSGGLTFQVTPTPTPTPTPAPGSTPTPLPTPTPVPTPTPFPTPTAASRFIFGITVFESSFGYQAGQITNGTVTPIATDFTDTGLGQNIVTQLITDPVGRFLYALNLGASSAGVTIGNPGIAEMQINPVTGVLTRVPGSPLVFASQQPGMLAIERSGRFLYQPNAGVFDIYSINQTSGLLSKISSSTATSLGFFTVTSPNGLFLFNATDQIVESLAIASDGSLTLAQPPLLTGGSTMGLAGQLAVSSDNQFLFVLNQGTISIFNISSTGLLTPVVGSPFITDAGATGFVIAPDGRHLYVAFQTTTNFVKGFTFDPVANTLTPIAGAAITDNALSITIDGSGQFAYVTESGQLVTYFIDPATGALTRVSQVNKPISEGVQSIITAP
jgi:6-phosphogluconolactonase (cycloisomerase 2 family)